MGKWLTCLPRLTLAQLRTLRSTTGGACSKDLEKLCKRFPSPPGRLTFACCLQGGGVYVYSGTVTITSSSIYGNTATFVVRAHAQIPHRPDGGKIPHAPMGKWLTCLPRLTLAQLRTLRSTTGGACHRNLEKFHRPHGKIADVLAPTHACTTSNAPVNYRMYVPQRH